jgi:hypothetical protein
MYNVKVKNNITLNFLLVLFFVNAWRLTVYFELNKKLIDEVLTEDLELLRIKSKDS